MVAIGIQWPLLPVNCRVKRLMATQRNAIREMYAILCCLFKVQSQQSPVYRPRSSCRAERAVQVIVDSLQKCCTNLRKEVRGTTAASHVDSK